jgi:hypothetical protein
MLRHYLVCASAALLVVCAGPARGAPDVAKWSAILAGPEGDTPLPAPLPKVVWRGDLGNAMAQARRENRPLFVTMRCLPCKQCSAFDKDVLEGGPQLDPLLRHFVTVRLTDVQDVDLRLLPMPTFQDLDLSWWGWFLSPEGKVYGVFGGRDEVSDETRISVPALANAMKRVMAHHYDPRRGTWDLDGPGPLKGPLVTPRTLPGYDSWRAKGHAEVKAQTCIHCHQVAEILRQPAVDLKQFDKHRDFEVWPLPENVGLKLDRDDGLRVTQVFPGGVAEKAGLRAGDELAAAGDRRLFGQADLRGVLHRGPRGAGPVDVYWTRDGKVMGGTLHVPEGWRRTVLDWRMSVSQGNVGAYPSFFPLSAANKRQQRNIPAGSMAVEPYAPGGPAKATGVRGDDVITAVGAESPDVAGRGFLVWFKMRYERGDEVTLTLKDPQGRQRTVTYPLAE